MPRDVGQYQRTVDAGYATQPDVLLALIDGATAGCFDGITPTGLHPNMGGGADHLLPASHLDLVAAGELTLGRETPRLP